MRYLLAIAIIVVLAGPYLTACLGEPMIATQGGRGEPLPQLTGRLTAWGDRTVVLSWRRFHTGKGQYDWEYVDGLLDAKAPAHLILLNQAANPPRDLTPQWVYGLLSNITPPLSDWPGEGKTGYWVSDCGGWPIPRYDSYTWRYYYHQAVRALGERYDGDPRLGSVAISLGLDGEPHIVKSVNGCEPSLSGIEGLEYRFAQAVDASIGVYAEAFPTTPVYMQTAVGGEARAHWAQLAVDNSIGLKWAGLGGDFLGWESDDPSLGTGSTDPLRLWGPQGVPLLLETKSGLGDEATKREALIAALRYMPQGIIVHNEYTELDRGFLRWVDAHLGKPIREQPSVFIHFRETEFSQRCWTGSDGKRRCIYGRRGDDALGITAVVEGEPRTGGPDWRGAHYREGAYWELDVADEYIAEEYDIKITVLDTIAGGVFTVTWSTTGDGGIRQREVGLEGGGGWMQRVFPLADFSPSGVTNIIITGEGHIGIDSVEVIGWPMAIDPGGEPTATPTPERPTATILPTPTPSPTKAGEATPTATPTIDLYREIQRLNGEICRRLGLEVPCGEIIWTFVFRQ